MKALRRPLSGECQSFYPRARLGMFPESASGGAFIGARP